VHATASVLDVVGAPDAPSGGMVGCAGADGGVPLAPGPRDPEVSVRGGIPSPVERTRWHLDPRAADEDGLVGVGADLDVSTLVAAYAVGVFPWPHQGMPLLWFSPDPRAILTHRRFRVSRSLRRTMLRCRWTTTVDSATQEVIRACADRPEGTWITGEMQEAYLELAALGWVHSVEVWESEALVGGVYGVQMGGIFTAESMFHRRTDASKVAVADLLERLDEAGGTFVDAQLMTDHLRSLGAIDIARDDFLDALSLERSDAARLRRDRLPVSRLAAR
jgi:leucyl/phenylalanyl-tRNA---protein transferase